MKLHAYYYMLLIIFGMCEKNCHNPIILKFRKVIINMLLALLSYQKINYIFLRETKSRIWTELIVSLSAISSSSEYSDIIGKRSGRCTVMQNDAEVKEPIRMGGKKRSLGSVGICASDMLVWLVHSWIFTKRSDMTNNPVNPHATLKIFGIVKKSIKFCAVISILSTFLVCKM
jgi:hypothetical protein